MEMTGDASAGVDVPVEDGLIEKLSEGDKNPMFVTIEVINEGVSRNGRAYDRETIISLAEQINAKKPTGYFGHLKDDERGNKFPEPQTIWIGAKVEEVGGKVRLFAKGYVLPEAKSLRSFLKKAKAISKNVAVSVYGLAQVVVDKVSNTQLVKSMQLESIDWARPGSEGVPNMGLFTVTSEMADDSEDIKKQGESKPMNKQEVLKSATAAELKEANPEVVSEMVTEAVEAKQAELETVVSEMADVRQSLGLKEDQSVTSVIAEMQQQLKEAELDNQLREKVESPTARKMVKELVVGEMVSDTTLTVANAVDKVLESESGKALVAEMLEVAPKVSPKTEQPSVVARKYTKKG